jgi:hypothetical protein
MSNISFDASLLYDIINGDNKITVTAVSEQIQESDRSAPLTYTPGGLEYTLAESGTFYICTGIGTEKSTDIEILSTYNNLPVSYIEADAFANNTHIENVVIQTGVLGIRPGAFSGCSNLKTVTMPPTLTSIGDRAFQSCTSLKKVHIPVLVRIIGRFAFSECSSLTSCTTVEGGELVNIDNMAFNGCDQLTSFTIPSSVQYLGMHIFYGCAGIKSVYGVTFNNPYGWFRYGAGSDFDEVGIPTPGTHIPSSSLLDAKTAATILIDDAAGGDNWRKIVKMPKPIIEYESEGSSIITIDDPSGIATYFNVYVNDSTLAGAKIIVKDGTVNYY